MLKRTKLNKVSEKQKVKNELKKEQTKERHNMFLEIWDELEQETNNGNLYVTCFETDRFLFREQYRENTCIYHHILEKSCSKFPQYDLCKWNIVILHPDIHSQVHTNIDKTPKVKAETERLYQLHLDGLL